MEASVPNTSINKKEQFIQLLDDQTLVDTILEDKALVNKILDKILVDTILEDKTLIDILVNKMQLGKRLNKQILNEILLNKLRNWWSNLPNENKNAEFIKNMHKAKGPIEIDGIKFIKESTGHDEINEKLNAYITIVEYTFKKQGQYDDEIVKLLNTTPGQIGGIKSRHRRKNKSNRRKRKTVRK